LKGADSEGLWQFVGCDGQLLQLVTGDKHAESVVATAKSAGLESSGRHRHHHHKSSTHRHGDKAASLRPKDKSASLRRHHHHHRESPESSSPAKPTASAASTPASPAVDAASSNSTAATTSTAAAAAPAPTTETPAAAARPLLVGFHTETGKRESNEDAHIMDLSLPFDASTAIFAVFDGHGGAKASRFCEKKFVSFLEKTKAYKTDKTAALSEAFIKCDKKYIEKVEDDGCTAVVVLVTGDNRLHVAWAGDSRAILIPASAQPSGVHALTSDHKPEHEKEKKRIEASGHEVIRDTIVQHGKRVHTYRIDSVLSVARSIGDAEYKDSFDLDASEQAVTCVPDVLDRQATPGDILLLACDGLFDVMTNEVVADKVRAARAAGDALDAIAKSLVNVAINELGSDDNVSVVIVEIPK
jgi:protein phosphatase 2C family protein 2/3